MVEQTLDQKRVVKMKIPKYFLPKNYQKNQSSIKNNLLSKSIQVSTNKQIVFDEILHEDDQMIVIKKKKKRYLFDSTMQELKTLSKLKESINKSINEINLIKNHALNF